MFRTFEIICSCPKRNKFREALQITEDPSHINETTCEFDCPNAHEPYCNKYLTIKLPQGIKPFLDRTGLRIVR